MSWSPQATLLLVSAIVTVAFAICLLAAARGLGEAGQGTGRWVMGDLFVALARSLMLLLGADPPSWLPDALAQRPLALPAGLFLSAIWLHGSALRHAGGHTVLTTRQTALVVVGIVGITIGVLLMVDEPVTRARLFRFFNLVGAAAILVRSWALLRQSWSGLLITVPLVSSMAFSLVQLLRPPEVWTQPQPTEIGFIADLVVHLFLATGFMLLLQERLRKRILELGNTDALTGARNRHGMAPILEHELSIGHRNGRPMSIVLFDLDHFKQVNDRHGHDVGDRVLRAFAAHVMRAVRRSDVLGRWGGEEFLLLLPETPLDAAAQLADRIRTQVAIGPLAAGLPPVTVSAGLAQSVGKEDDSLERLFKLADERLYVAKRTRNCVVASDDLTESRA